MNLIHLVFLTMASVLFCVSNLNSNFKTLLSVFSSLVKRYASVNSILFEFGEWSFELHLLFFELHLVFHWIMLKIFMKITMCQKSIFPQQINSPRSYSLNDKKQPFAYVLQNRCILKFLNITEKHLCWSLFLIKLPSALQLY